MFKFNTNNLQWFCKPKNFTVTEERIEIITEPNTDLWQKTYYGFQNDNAHIVYVTAKEKYFTFTVKTEFEYSELFDQCGIAIYQNSNNWVKAGIEFRNKNSSWLGSVVTNNGYSDWATTELETNYKSMWYRISRRENDFCIENSVDGKIFKQLRIFHLFDATEDIRIGLLACSPKNNSFKAIFTNIEVTECLWEEHK
ncbi:MAG TPA: DUF1349 domain-containing protein [Leptospiraceae bacterium]|nr:DUF1349 domain-containing protein [Leptospiraceae bacterium]HMW03490.1 DUF1349 domain-containing protein [Leptospiraceae bacterium]HMY29590.1 DUF1349 domain-containing protein [Leptospiraceae bacterium]HMZ62920.1 DUF1349 domain-containing protein [Leptospiraceae bacterium]HNA05971.1 DUF1349 domain-containing protein [Leptospiraceae bacterium]